MINVIFISYFSELEQSLAGLIADRATDEVLEALTRYKRGLGIPDSPNNTLNNQITPDIVRSRSSHVSFYLILNCIVLKYLRKGSITCIYISIHHKT